MSDCTGSTVLFILENNVQQSGQKISLTALNHFLHLGSVDFKEGENNKHNQFLQEFSHFSILSKRSESPINIFFFLNIPDQEMQLTRLFVLLV